MLTSGRSFCPIYLCLKETFLNLKKIVNGCHFALKWCGQIILCTKDLHELLEKRCTQKMFHP